jgi:hypothetical protein
MLSSLDSTLATACWRNEPHLEDCFVGAAIIGMPAVLLLWGRVASFEVAPGHTSQFVVGVRGEKTVYPVIARAQFVKQPGSSDCWHKLHLRFHWGTEFPTAAWGGIACFEVVRRPETTFRLAALKLAASLQRRGYDEAAKALSFHWHYLRSPEE